MDLAPPSLAGLISSPSMEYFSAPFRSEKARRSGRGVPADRRRALSTSRHRPYPCQEENHPSHQWQGPERLTRKNLRGHPVEARPNPAGLFFLDYSAGRLVVHVASRNGHLLAPWGTQRWPGFRAARMPQLLKPRIHPAFAGLLHARRLRVSWPRLAMVARSLQRSMATVPHLGCSCVERNPTRKLELDCKVASRVIQQPA